MPGLSATMLTCDKKLTVGSDDPQHVGHEEIRKRPRDHHEELRVLLPHAPELERLDERLAGRDLVHRRGILKHAVDRLLPVERLGTGVCICRALAVVCGLFDDKEGENE